MLKTGHREIVAPVPARTPIKAFTLLGLSHKNNMATCPAPRRVVGRSRLVG
jgi:hypothetical protein